MVLVDLSIAQLRMLVAAMVDRSTSGVVRILKEEENRYFEISRDLEISHDDLGDTWIKIRHHKAAQSGS